jgi:hypothetical protein
MISLLLGFFSSILPQALKMWGDWSDKKHELDLLKLQFEHADKVALRQLDLAEIEAAGRIQQSTVESDAKIVTQAHKWAIDINALIRPLGALFAYWTIGFVVYHSLYGSAAVATTLLGIPLVVETCQFIIGYWFGQRSVVKLSGRV